MPIMIEHVHSYSPSRIILSTPGSSDRTAETASRFHSITRAKFASPIEAIIDKELSRLNVLTKTFSKLKERNINELIRLTSEVGKTFFFSHPYVVEDFLADRKDVGHIASDYHFRYTDPESQSENEVLLTSLKSFNVGGYTNRFGFLLQDVTSISGENYILRIPLFMVDQQIVDMVRKHDTQNKIFALYGAIGTVSNHDYIHSAVRGIDDGAEITKWVEQMKSAPVLVRFKSGDSLPNYEVFSALNQLIESPL